jgi:prevent-host-death family protein
MATVGAYEAKTHLPRLLERVAQGETITITKHGKPVAVLAPPPEAEPRRDLSEVFARMDEIRRQTKPDPDGWTLKQLINHGRRF